MEFHEDTLSCSIQIQNEKWEFSEDFHPRIELETGSVYFENAQHITHKKWKTGVGEGVISRYEGFQTGDRDLNLVFETVIWVEEATGDVLFEWMPISEDEVTVKNVYWPGFMAFEEKKDSWYTLLNWQQGLLIPNTWPVATEKAVFDGYFGTAGCYMPWFGQVRDGAGYMAICETPWNAAYYVSHPENGPHTHVGMRFEPSLGKMQYKRVMRYKFMNNCDYNALCKAYRAYAIERGKFRSLEEKAVRNPSVNRLIGSAFLHKGIKTQVKENSEFFDPKEPEKNNHITPFHVRAEEIKALHREGVEKVYLHLDGWAEPGYDNQHPDYTPACHKAGGWAEMKALADVMHEYGDLFGIHDQYRDYYRDAETFDEEFACHSADGSVPGHARWAGGPQTILCGTQAPYYVKRNFKALSDNGIKLDCAYLDVFTCNEGDECSHPWHRMTRRDCYDYRNLCFDYLLANNILSSSEEVNDWAIKSLVFCHYAPYDFMMRKPGTEKRGLPVPLFNLVYHDCVIVPWMMDKVSETEDYMLYALLNGGAPYLERDGAYQNTDGAFRDSLEMERKEKIRRCNVVSELHKKVAKCEMVSHTFVDGNTNIHRTLFDDGTTVTVDLEKQSYTIDMM